MNKTIGIVVALPGEARALVGPCPWKKVNGFLHCRTVLQNDTVLVVVQSGMGMDNASSAARWLSERDVSALGCFGVSGGLDPALGIGELVFADAVFMAQDDGIPLVWKRGRRSSEVSFPCVEAKNMAVCWGPIVTVERPVLNAVGKRALFDGTGTLAVDMETAGVARIANRSGLPFFAIRRICDTADVTVPETLFHCIDSNGHPRMTYLLRLIIRKPSIISHLLSMKRNFTRALVNTSRLRNCLASMHIPPAYG